MIPTTTPPTTNNSEKDIAVVSVNDNKPSNRSNVIEFESSDVLETRRLRKALIKKHITKINELLTGVDVARSISNASERQNALRRTELFQKFPEQYRSYFQPPEPNATNDNGLEDLFLDLALLLEERGCVGDVTATTTTTTESNDDSINLLESGLQLSRFESCKYIFDQLKDQRMTDLHHKVRGCRSLYGYRADGRTVFGYVIDYVEDALNLLGLGECPQVMKQLVEQFYQGTPLYRVQVTVNRNGSRKVISTFN